jgi:serine phosphatase RsbU (regulator of sigma subunit)
VDPGTESIRAGVDAAAFERRIESLTVNLLECYEELDLIYRLSRRLRSTLDAQESAEAVLFEAMEIFEADFGWILPADGAPPVFAPRLTGAEPGAAEPLAPIVNRNLAGAGRSRILESVHRELGLKAHGLPESLLCAVIKTEGAVYGALCVGRSAAGRHFTARDLKLSEVLASQAAIGIENWILQQKRREEEQARIRIEEEIRLAREIQSSLLPNGPPRIQGYDIACRGIPAHSVGGDYYDFIPVDEGRLALCLADVSGHGMPAALLMANLQAMIRCQAIAALSPSECVRRCNRLLFRSTDAGRFATCFYGVLDVGSGILTYSNAGHNHPLVVPPSGASVALSTGGLLLGVHEEPEYQEASLMLERGHALVLYSDGITEFFDGQDREFGVEGLEAAVGRARTGTAAQILDEILRAVGAHGNGLPQSDDMTLVVLRRL